MVVKGVFFDGIRISDDCINTLVFDLDHICSVSKALSKRPVSVGLKFDGRSLMF